MLNIMWAHKCLLALIIHCHCHGVACDLDPKQLAEHPGHLKKYASEGKFKYVEELGYAPDTAEFFRDYVASSRPVILKGVTKDTKPYQSWTDEYFLNLSIPLEDTVGIQNKENQIFSYRMHFHEFVKTYKETKAYLESGVLPALRSDVVLPRPLQCNHFLTKLHSTQMWFSNGGTQSIVHNDGADNLLCMYAGEKEATLLHPDEYLNKKGIRGMVVALSNISINRVDYTQHPDLADIEYYHKAHIKAGDCLYIPYNWIHQVNSYHRNLAVNVWWFHQYNSSYMISHCSNSPEPNITLGSNIDPIVLTGHISRNQLHYFLLDITRDYPVSLADFYEYIVKYVAVDQYYIHIFQQRGDKVPVGFSTYQEDFLQKLVQHPDVMLQYSTDIKPLVLPLDTDHDEMISSKEFARAPMEEIKSILKMVRELRITVRKLAENMKNADKENETDLKIKNVEEDQHTEL